MSPYTLLVMVIVVAMVFEFINGFHDTANAIATVVSTGVMRPRMAVLMAAVLNVLGAFQGTAVARTIGSDILAPGEVTQVVILSALMAAVTWNLFTWYFGIPSSSSHALIGGMLGAGWMSGGMAAVQGPGVTVVFWSLLLSPAVGFAAALAMMVALSWLVRGVSMARINRNFRVLQLGSSCLMAYSHGANDAQKTMGIVTLALGSYQASLAPAGEVPTWVAVGCAAIMGLGTMAGGWRIIRTMGQRIFKLRPIHGFAAETGAACVLQFAAAFGIPTSTTHCITAAIIGVGATTRLSAVSWGLTQRILAAWILTIPICAVLSIFLLTLLRVLGW